MKKKITFTLTVLLLLAAFSGCGGVKEEDILGTWEFTYTQSADGTTVRHTYGVPHRVTFKKDGTAESVDGPCVIICETYTWKISGSGRILLTAEDGEEFEFGRYSDGEIVADLYKWSGQSENKRIYIKQ